MEAAHFISNGLSTTDAVSQLIRIARVRLQLAQQDSLRLSCAEFDDLGALGQHCRTRAIGNKSIHVLPREHAQRY